ncbi:MAG TPA: hypothetical protein VGM54_08460 [Chthoniobacter sp.]
MNLRPKVSATFFTRIILCLWAIGMARGLADESAFNDNGATTAKQSGDLKKELVGTSWKASPTQPLRGGLAPILTFTEDRVAPAGYQYEVNGKDRITIHFNHGDTQAMELSPNGKRFTFTFADRSYSYELLDTTGKARMGLAGTTWEAAPREHLRPGLPAHLNFGEETVVPAGYRYDVNGADSITIHFNHGDTQLMLLSANGKQLSFIFDDRFYHYELVSEESKSEP